MPNRYLQDLAELAVRFGANVQPGQIVAISSEPGKEELARALAEAAYRRGALFVDLNVFDVYFKRARARYADPDTLEYVPPWYGSRALALGDHHAARIALSGVVEPHALDDVDPGRVGRDMLPSVKEGTKVLNDRSTNWTVVPGPNRQWATLVYPDLEPAAALTRLWEAIAHVCRLDEPDPIAAWQSRIDTLLAVARRLDALRLDALHFEGPGTDLTIGLLDGSHWICGDLRREDGLAHRPNIPTEEVFTTPDPERVDGVVRATKPLFTSGVVITGLEVRFEKGRAVQIEAEHGAATLRTLTSRDEGAARLGEVALVDREGRIGPLATVFYDTLLDENAASHIAFGQGFLFAVDEPDQAAINSSEIHIDCMIGSNDVAVTGVTREGRRLALLRGGAWQI